MFARIEDLKIDNIHINTVAKTASASFLDSLKDKFPKIHHGHSLLDLADVIKNRRNTFIISGIRNPLDRNISYFFQTFADDFFNDVKISKNNYKGEYCFVMTKDELLNTNPLDLIKIFKSQQNHYTFNDWFYEFFSITKVLNEQFDKKNGIKIYQLPNNNHLMFYTLENLGANENFIKSFFGIKNFFHSNNSARRKDAEIYKVFKSLLTLDSDYKQKLLQTSIMKYFYTDPTIESFFQKY